MASDPVRIALVGAGRMGSVHLGALQSSETIELAGVVEPVSARRDELSADGIRVYAGVEEMLDTDSPEGVLIAAPSDQHPGLVSTFARRGDPDAV